MTDTSEKWEVRAPPVDPDAELVAATRRDAAAFLALYDRYVDRILGSTPGALRVVALEYLPKTAATLRLLSLPAQHPEARVKVNPAAWNGK
jgi:hypothetical protein